MPINVTPTSGLSDRSIEVRSHTGRGNHERMVTSESLRSGSPSGHVPDDVHGILVAKQFLHHYEKNESRGFSG
jgi:hypothetical protein